jgi:hypothetical protein
MLSDEKITYLTHVILKGLLNKNLITLKDDEGRARRAMKRAILYELKIGEEMDRIVRRKIQSLSKKVYEGSPEWEVLYKKFLKEEEIKRGRGT